MWIQVKPGSGKIVFAIIQNFQSLEASVSIYLFAGVVNSTKYFGIAFPESDTQDAGGVPAKTGVSSTLLIARVNKKLEHAP